MRNSIHETTRRWSMRENDRVLDEIAQRQQNLRKTTMTTQRRDESPVCLHDRLMFEIKQQRVLKPIHNQSAETTMSFDSPRKRIRPVQVCQRFFSFSSNEKLEQFLYFQILDESDFSSDDDDERDEHGRKRVAVIDCLLESSPDDNTECNSFFCTIKEKEKYLIWIF